MIKLKKIQGMVDEFDKAEGSITIEFSVKWTDLRRVFKQLNKIPSKYGIWAATTCKTCEGYHGKGYVHVELHPFKWIPYKASNLLFLSKSKEVRNA